MKTPKYIEVDLLGVDRFDIDSIILFIECNTPAPTVEERGRYLYLSDFINLEQYLYVAHYLESYDFTWKPIEESSEVYFLFVVWGSEAVGIYENHWNGEELTPEQKECLNCCLHEYTFKTKGERDAFAQGAEDADGWTKTTILQDAGITELINTKTYQK